MTPLADAKSMKNAAVGRIRSNRLTADLHLNFQLSTFNFQLNSPLFNPLAVHDSICLHSEKGAKAPFLLIKQRGKHEKIEKNIYHRAGHGLRGGFNDVSGKPWPQKS